MTDGGGNLSADPLFVDAANGDVRLQSGSPAIDKGTNAAITATTDLDGNPRLVDGDGDGTATVDMGAYEACPAGPVAYVDADATPPGFGTTWANAYTDLNTALATARRCSSITQVWVAEGVYTPGTTESATFDLPPGVAVYGGFAGAETTLSERNWVLNPTVLSGDLFDDDTSKLNWGLLIDPDGITGTNSYHVVTANGSAGTPITATTRLDGFSITAGQADGSLYDARGGGFLCRGDGSGSVCSPSLANLVFAGNEASDQGGGLANYGPYNGESSPSLVNVNFIYNRADYGGAMYNDGYQGTSSPSLVNIQFAVNKATSDGGAMYNSGTDGGESSPSIINATFYSNTAAFGGAMLNDGTSGGESSPSLTNVILWGNTASSSGAQVYNDDATLTLKTSLVQGGFNGAGVVNNGSSGVTNDGGNLSADPLFVDLTDLRLQFGSPAIDTGTNGAITVATDLEGNTRKLDGDGDGTVTVDMGAFEAPTYYALTVTTAGDGSGQVGHAPTGESCTSPCSALYKTGTSVTLTPTPASGSSFTSWGGACTGNGACVVSMTAAKSVTATFTKNPLPTAAPDFTSTPGMTGTVGVAYSYSVTASDADGGDTLTITAPTKPAWLTLTPTGNGTATLTGAPGAGDLGANAVSLRVEDQSGKFDTQSFTITVSAAPVETGDVQGTVVDDDGNGVAGAQVELTGSDGAVVVAAIPAQTTDANGGYAFSDVPAGDYTLTVSKDGYDPATPVSVTVQAGKTANASTVVLTPTLATLRLPLLRRVVSVAAAAAATKPEQPLYLPALAR